MQYLFSTKKSLLLINKTLLVYSSFIIAFAIVVVAFTTSTTYIQLSLAVLFYLLLVFVAYKLLPKKILRQSPKKITTAINSPADLMENETDYLEKKDLARLGIADIDKRVFLTVIGTTGLFLLLFSLFNKKTESLLFKNLPGLNGYASPDKNGDTVEPTQNQPMDEYRISEIDDNVVSFYGFIKKDGSWYIMRIDTNTGTIRYTKGESDFSQDWTNRKNLKYDYVSKVF